MASEFSKNQLEDVSLQRELGWGTHVVNRTCYQQWIALAFRLGMDENVSEITRTLRNWMESPAPVPSENRGGFRESSSTRVRTADFAFGSGSDRGRSLTRDGRDRRQSTSRDRRSNSRSLNRGSSGRFVGSKRTRDDY